MNAPPFYDLDICLWTGFETILLNIWEGGGGSTKNKIYPKRTWFICYQNRPRSKFYHIFFKYNLGNTFWDSTYFFILASIVFSQKLLKNIIFFSCQVHHTRHDVNLVYDNVAGIQKMDSTGFVYSRQLVSTFSFYNHF